MRNELLAELFRRRGCATSAFHKQFLLRIGPDGGQCSLHVIPHALVEIPFGRIGEALAPHLIPASDVAANVVKGTADLGADRSVLGIA
jgi:hypothetical protein